MTQIGRVAAVEQVLPEDAGIGGVPLQRANNDFVPVARAAGESSNITGGFLVPTELDQTITVKIKVKAAP